MSAMHWEARRKQYVINKAHDVREKWNKEKHDPKTLVFQNGFPAELNLAIIVFDHNRCLLLDLEQAKNQGFPDIPDLNNLLPKEVDPIPAHLKISETDARKMYRDVHLDSYTAKLPNRYNSLSYGQQW